MATHELKVWPEFFFDLSSGEKNFELRKDDRDFRVGDYLMLREFHPDSGQFTGEWLEARIEYILRNAEKFGLMPGYCILALGPIIQE